MAEESGKLKKVKKSAGRTILWIASIFVLGIAGASSVTVVEPSERGVMVMLGEVSGSAKRNALSRAVRKRNQKIFDCSERNERHVQRGKRRCNYERYADGRLAGYGFLSI